MFRSLGVECETAGYFLMYTWQHTLMDMAESLASMSHDPKLKVGCIITSEDFRDVLATGINGNASGLPNKRDSDEAGASGFIHAEVNAAINCKAPREVSKVAFVTTFPCAQCVKALINLGGVKHIYYRDIYTKAEYDKVRYMLIKVGIEFDQVCNPPEQKS